MIRISLTSISAFAVVGVSVAEDTPVNDMELGRLYGCITEAHHLSVSGSLDPAANTTLPVKGAAGKSISVYRAMCVKTSSKSADCGSQHEGTSDFLIVQDTDLSETGWTAYEEVLDSGYYSSLTDSSMMVVDGFRLWEAHSWLSSTTQSDTMITSTKRMNCFDIGPSRYR